MPAPVSSVDKERWQQAQKWEYQHWLTENRFLIKTPLRILKDAVKKIFGHSIPDHGPGDDWNSWWFEKFESYQLLPREFGCAVEFGCGPYTNIRLIREGRKLSKIYCSDPLAHKYLEFRGRFLAEASRRGEIEVDSSLMEESGYSDESFDLTVVINVLDHVMDAGRCLDTVARVTKRGGFFVFGQELTNEEDLARLPEILNELKMEEDIGHPIRLDHVYLDEKILPNFEPIFYRILSREDGRAPTAHYGTYLFIGTKR